MYRNITQTKVLLYEIIERNMADNPKIFPQNKRMTIYVVGNRTHIQQDGWPANMPTTARCH